MIPKAMELAKQLLGEDTSGHDFHHTLRVYHLAARIAEEESANQILDLEIVGLIALLHDVDDRKLSPDTCKDLGRARRFLEENGISGLRRDMILNGIRQISYKGTDSEVPDLPEARCVQDADRLDAMGAIGIARAFAFGGNRNRAMYDPKVPPRENMDEAAYVQNKGHTINHFYEKLLLLKDMMNTETGKRMAVHRHAYMKDFLEEFYAEWDGLR